MYSKYKTSRTMALHESGTHMLRRCSWKRWILHSSTAPTGRSWIKWSAYTWGLQNQSTLATIRPTCIYCAWSTWDHLRWIGSKPMDEWYARSVMCIITLWCYVGETHKLLSMLRIQNSRVPNLLPIYNSIQRNRPPNHPLSLNSTGSSWIWNLASDIFCSATITSSLAN